MIVSPYMTGSCELILKYQHTHLGYISLGLRVKHTGCNQTVMLAMKLLNSNTS